MITTPPRPRARTPRQDPATDRRLAQVHLRMGQLELARAELEALAGSGSLDDEGLLALSEARWRTGDLTGAGEAAQAYLTAGGQDVIALVIAAEANGAVGRPGEARRLAGQALERADVPLDRIFAGIPRSLIWPADSSEAGQPTGMLFPAPTPTTRSGSYGDAGSGSAASMRVAGSRDRDAATPLSGDAPDAETELVAGKAALADGRHGRAAVHFALAMRQATGLAPAVLDAIEATERRTAPLEIVRGDAYRLVGREVEAQRAYATAAASAHADAGNGHRAEAGS
ncbi:MAG TPA: hypothetical protein VGC90_04770 [Candidatus Limnocylindrales bacterium]